MRRREFMKQSAIGGAAFAAVDLAAIALPDRAEAFSTSGGLGIDEGLYLVERGKEKNVMPKLRSEIVNNPRAVFLIETHVDARREADGLFTEARPQLFDAGKQIAPWIFEKGSSKGGSTLILPNFTNVPTPELQGDPTVGIITSPDFIAGFTAALRDMGNTNVITSSRGVTAKNHRQAGIYTVFDEHNINLIEANYDRFEHYEKDDLNWARVQGKPMVWKNIPTTRPIGDKDNFFINMPTLKNHNLGLTTLSIKNLQGAVPTGYGHYCNQWAAMEMLCKYSYDIDFKRNFVKDYYQNVESAFIKHIEAGFKYWDVDNAYDAYQKKGGWKVFEQVKNDRDELKEFMSDVPGSLMWDEQWAQRALDSADAIRPNLNIIEGIIGRDGSGFNVGKDELCNVVVVGMSMPEVDAVGSYIMGHDPTELPYTRIATERGLGESDLSKIDIYWIRDGQVTPVRNISEIKRYKLGVNFHTWSETGKRLFW